MQTMIFMIFMIIGFEGWDRSSNHGGKVANRIVYLA